MSIHPGDSELQLPRQIRSVCVTFAPRPLYCCSTAVCLHDDTTGPRRVGHKTSAGHPGSRSAKRVSSIRNRLPLSGAAAQRGCPVPECGCHFRVLKRSVEDYVLSCRRFCQTHRSLKQALLVCDLENDPEASLYARGTRSSSPGCAWRSPSEKFRRHGTMSKAARS